MKRILNHGGPCFAGAVLVALIFWVSPSFAHHSFSAEYNITALITLKGEITSVEWANPHVFITVAVKDSNGSVQGWRVEGGAVNALKENGWTPEMLRQMVKTHETVTIAGYRHRSDAASVRNASSKPVNLTGTVSKLEWINPQIYLYIAVKDPSTGSVSNFSFLLADPDSMAQSGWSRNMFQTGMVVSFTGTLAQDGTNKGIASSVTLPDGRTWNTLSVAYSPQLNNGVWAKEIELADGRKLAFN